MIKQLTPDQINKHWRQISYSISQCLPPRELMHPGYMHTIKSSLDVGDMQCWVGFGDDGNTDLICTTYIYIDRITGLRALVVFSVYSCRRDVSGSYNDLIKMLGDYSQSRDCFNVVHMPKLEVV